MAEKHILATSAGYTFKDGVPSFGPVIRYGLELTGKDGPKLCYLGTASGDDPKRIETFYKMCESTNIEPSHLQLFSMPNVTNVREHILNADMILVPGGSVANLLALWRLHGLDKIFREAWECGIVLCGWSAGSICWHVGGTTDSFGKDLQPVTNGLSFLPYSNGVHYDNEEQRRPLFQKLIAEGVLSEGYATDDGVGLHYINNELFKVVSETSGKFAYHVVKTEHGVVETRLEPELLRA